MVKQKTVYNFFKFLEDERGEKIPTKAKFLTNIDNLSKEELVIEGDLVLNNLPIKELPENLEISGNLFIAHTKIKKLPDKIKVKGGIYATSSELEYLPNNLHTGIVVCDYSNLQEIPYNLQLKGSFYLDNTPLVRKYTDEEIGKMIEDKGGYVRGYVRGSVW